MTENAIRDVLDAALKKTRDGSLKWRAAQRQGRYLADLKEWRLRIESATQRGGPPFKFSIMQPGSGLGQIAEIRSVPPGEETENTLNDSLRDLWELVQPPPEEPEPSNEQKRAKSLEGLRRALDPTDR